ncbi:MAG: hypothetical protein LBV67_01585 [Streptococcaceae bacterium]|jgi:hypothetical protein|nr:hypothetical protein [Streptococcaceae bacterium]
MTKLTAKTVADFLKNLYFDKYETMSIYRYNLVDNFYGYLGTLDETSKLLNELEVYGTSDLMELLHSADPADILEELDFYKYVDDELFINVDGNEKYEHDENDEIVYNYLEDTVLPLIEVEWMNKYSNDELKDFYSFRGFHMSKNSSIYLNEDMVELEFDYWSSENDKKYISFKISDLAQMIEQGKITLTAEQLA